MKNLHQYLTESTKTFNYTIKLAGEFDSKTVDLFVHNLKKFDPVKIDEPKKTPIQSDPYGFPGMKNQSITIIRAEFKYPTTEPHIQQVARLLGINENCVRVISSDFNDSIKAEAENTDNESTAKKASKAYANQYLDNVMPKKPTIQHQYAGTKTPTVSNTSAENIQTKSPMSTVKRPTKGALK